MKIEIKIPNMGESITEATIGSLLKPSGSKVNLDDEILELETDKVNQVIYAPNNGIITFNVSPGQMVKIGEVIAFLDTEGEQKKEEKEKIPEEKKLIGQAKGQEKDLPSDLTSTSEKKEDEASKGPRRTKENFLEELKVKEKPPAPLKPKFPPSATVPAKDRMTRRKMSKVRKVIAERLVEAQRNAAMLTTFNEVDMTQVMAIREKYKEQFMKEHKVKLGLMSFFVKASVDALQLFPDCNSFIEGEDIVHREYFDIGIAVGTDKGLFVPVVRDCNIKSFAEIEISIESYANKAKEGSLALEDLQGAGFTITNGGVYGSLLSTPIINPPQCAILGLHKISKRAVVVDDQIVIRPMMYLALSYDHRLIDGKVAVSFLVHIKNLLEDPARVLLNLS